MSTSDPLTYPILTDMRQKETPQDPNLVRYREIKRQIIALRNEEKELVDKLRNGICEVCGQAFTRQRPTKRVCSQRCNVRLSESRRIKSVVDLDLIKKWLPVIEQSGLATPISINVARRVLAEGVAHRVGTELAVSTQRINQILQRLTLQARMIESISGVTSALVKKELGENKDRELAEAKS